MNNCRFLLLVICCCSLLACKTRGFINENNQGVAQKRSVKFLQRQLKAQSLSYTWFATSAKIKAESPEQKGSFVANIRIKKDSLIWIRLKKANIEGARVKITPKSIEILDRQQGVYVERTFGWLRSAYGITLSFQELQEVLVGNPILYKDPKFSNSIIDNQHVLESPSSDKLLLKFFMNSNNFLLQQLDGEMGKNSISIRHEAHDSIAGKAIPIKKSIEVEGEETGKVSVEMSYNKIVVDEPQKVGFRVPDSYERQ